MIWACGMFAEIALNQRPITRFEIPRQLELFCRVLTRAHCHQTAEGAGVPLERSFGLALDHRAALAEAFGDAAFLDEDRLLQLCSNLGRKVLRPFGSPCRIARLPRLEAGMDWRPGVADFIIFRMLGHDFPKCRGLLRGEPLTPPGWSRLPRVLPCLR